MKLTSEVIVGACGVGVAMGGFVLGRGVRPGGFGVLDYLDSIKPKLIFALCALAGLVVGGLSSGTLLEVLRDGNAFVMLILFTAFAVPFGEWCNERGRKLAQAEAHSLRLQRENDLLRAGYDPMPLHTKFATPLTHGNVTNSKSTNSN